MTMGENSFFYLYPGCLIRTRLPHLEKSARVVFDSFGVRFSDLEGASCCPDPVVMRGVDQETWLAMAARNMALAQNNSHTLMTLCSGCYSTFREAQHLLAKNALLLEKINRILKHIGYQYSPGSPVEHFARFIVEKIGIDELSSRMTRSWKGLPVAIHYGCHFLRPSNIMEFDDPENPTRLDELVSSLGAEVVDYPRKMLCCGFPIQANDADISLRMAYEKLNIIKEYKAEAVIVICPSCYLQFDLTQKTIERKFNVSLNLPVFYLTEFIGLVLGIAPSSLGLNFHRVGTDALIEKIFSEEGSGL